MTPSVGDHRPAGEKWLAGDHLQLLMQRCERCGLLLKVRGEPHPDYAVVPPCRGRRE